MSIPPRLHIVAGAFAAALGAMTANAAPGAAQAPDGAYGPPAASESTPGPVIDGRHRQPSRAEIKSRELAQGRSATSILREDHAKDREVDEIYRQLKSAPGSIRTTNPESSR